MIEEHSAQEAPLADEIVAAEILCRRALVADYPNLIHSAYVLDLSPALDDSGFLVGSEKRRRLYANGDFRPRETLVLWRRADIIAWTNSQSEFVGTARSRRAPLANASATRSLPAIPNCT
jgi:hypothetical protein